MTSEDVTAPERFHSSWPNFTPAEKAAIEAYAWAVLWEIAAGCDAVTTKGV